MRNLFQLTYALDFLAAVIIPSIAAYQAQAALQGSQQLNRSFSQTLFALREVAVADLPHLLARACGFSSVR